MEKLSAEEREERARLLAEVQQLEEYEKIHPPPPCRDLQPLRLHPVEREACRLLKASEVESLSNSQHVVVDEFLLTRVNLLPCSVTVEDAWRCAEQYFLDGHMTAAQLNTGSLAYQNSSIRSDRKAFQHALHQLRQAERVQVILLFSDCARYCLA